MILLILVDVNDSLSCSYRVISIIKIYCFPKHLVSNL